ncbi:RING-like domain protein [Apiospora hydei]|uniref:RING-like domain protein n=1 Tax=Apiospora hydei TaxID=1337664 RepID=A0ABR1WAW1_9PEZI
MLEYFTYKKVKKHRAEKAEKERVESANEDAHQGAASPTPKVISEPVGTPLLREEDERFLERLTSQDPDDDESVRPPLPPRIKTPTIEWDSDTESFVSKEGAKGKGKGQYADPKSDGAAGKPKRFATITTLGRNLSQRVRPTANSGLKPENVPPVTEREVIREETDITRILDDLDLSAKNNKVFSLSADSGEMVRKFNLVLKDLVNGVPTAYGDLTALLDDRDGTLARNYEKLPSSLKKLVTTLPNKLTSTLAPELLAVAAEAQGLGAEEAKKGGLKDAAKNFLTPKSLQDLVTKPGAVVGLLKGIVNALKVRWPAFIGTNVIWSLALFLLLSALWYCHKRGREVRLEAEAAARDPIDGSARIEELPDDPQLPAPSPRRSREKRGQVERTATAASSSKNKKNK